ncbi:alpha/beta hydrolase [Stutzerimonas azotifigens]|uniref:alpha/beta hydrolase n=1 Tax=Stutzerimonas azotifigens TaxID=291995 RepID=UPI00042719DF|nr:alpha/beta hydrolase-fold protein [Stutzerimonas azotifigens]
MKHWGWIALGCLPLITLARPDLSQKVGPTLADTGSAYYRFERFELDSTDGRRHYRIHLAVPKRAAPAEGYPALYLLDGNAVNAELREDWLAEMDERGPPLLVMIGYATELRFDVDARVYDYTPAPQPGQPLLEDEERRRPAGGAAQFLDLIEQRIKPHVALHHPVDPQRQGLWGHSYGGAFVLNALFTRPQAFQTYVAAEPSLWWQSGLLLRTEKELPVDTAARLLILRGTGETRPRAADDMPSARARAMAAVPADAARRMAERLSTYPRMQVDYRELAGLGHGPMLSASLLPALRLITQENHR